MTVEPSHVPETYGRALSGSAQLKLRAMSLLAEGGDEAEWRAVVLLHEARRAERRALLALEAPSPETRLRSVVEQCGCLVDGRDPTGILDSVWGEVLEASGAVPSVVATSIRRRLDPKVDALVREYAHEAGNAETFLRAADGEGIAPLGEGLRRDATLQAARMLKVFPGDSRLWRVTSMLHLARGDRDEAWSAVRRGRELDPDDRIASALEIGLVPDVLPPERASAFLDAASASAMRDPTDLGVCLNLASSLAVVARGATDPRLWWEKALEIATLGLGLPAPDPRDRKLCRFLQLSIREVLAGRQPKVDLLFRVGLGTLVPHIPESDRDDLLRAVRTLRRPARSQREAA